MNLTVGGAVLVLGTHCAVYEDELLAAGAGLEAAAGSVGDALAGSKPFAGATQAAGGAAQAGNGAFASASCGGGGNGGATIDAGSTPGSGANNAGQAALGGMTGVAGDVTPDSGVAGGGVAGSAGESGSGLDGAGATQNEPDRNLSRGKVTSADSEQTTRLHYAGDANDGDRSTRWCAADYRPNHYWEVDLGQTFSLSSLRILWEKDALYLFKLESSVDHTSWSLVLDKTHSNAPTANQEHALPPGTLGRYVRITVTGGITPTTWASFVELDVFGH